MAEPNAQLTPVAWQRFGDDYNLTGQFGMRPIFLSLGLRPKPGLKLLNMENSLLVPFSPEHPHAQRIVDGWNNTEKLQALLTAAREVVIDWESAGYVPKDSILKLREILKS